MFTSSSIGIIGSGAMGSGIAQVAASAGHKVILFDSNSFALENAQSNLDATLKKLAEKGSRALGTAEDAATIFSRIHFAAHLSELKHCELVIEAIVENLEIKQKVFSDIAEIVYGNCVLASNTSSLSITSIASGCAKPARVMGIHFFNPAPLMPLVEIIPGIFTDKNDIVKIKALMESWKKVPVIAKDTPGFIVNRVARPFYGESIRIYEEGIADFATIDSAMKENGFKMGPFELMDFIGNDVNYTVTETIWKQFFHDPRYKPSLTQKRLFEAKHFGKKSGKGYYDYSMEDVGGQISMSAPSARGNAIRIRQMADGNSSSQISPECSGQSQIFSRVLAMLINEAADALYYGVATKEDIDLAMTKGVNYPKGLLKWADEIGIEKVLSELEKLHAEYCEDRYRPSVLLRKMVREGVKFY